jgi:hypothetical protein
MRTVVTHVIREFTWCSPPSPGRAGLAGPARG